MKIYTRRGDRGQTDLFGGERVRKDHLRVEAYGSVDELNAFTGAAAAATSHADVRELLHGIQAALFDIGAVLASPDAERRAKAGTPEPTGDDVAALERRIDTFGEELEPLAHFVLPGGTPAAAAFHVARTVCRRAERCVVSLAEREEVDEVLVRYLNRLSDLLFVLARLENHRAGRADIPWIGRDRRERERGRW